MIRISVCTVHLQNTILLTIHFIIQQKKNRDFTLFQHCTSFLFVDKQKNIAAVNMQAKYATARSTDDYWMKKFRASTCRLYSLLLRSLYSFLAPSLLFTLYARNTIQIFTLLYITTIFKFKLLTSIQKTM